MVALVVFAFIDALSRVILVVFTFFDAVSTSCMESL